MENNITLPIIEKTNNVFIVKITKELLNKINKEPLNLIKELSEENLILKENLDILNKKFISLEKNYNELFNHIVNEYKNQIELLGKEIKIIIEE
jgi:predicted transcriptional regulator